jgi:hypothetical protein
LKHLCTFDVAIALTVKSLRSLLAAINQVDLAIEAWDLDCEINVQKVERGSSRMIRLMYVPVISALRFRRRHAKSNGWGTKTADEPTMRQIQGLVKAPFQRKAKMGSKAPH